MRIIVSFQPVIASVSHLATEGLVSLSLRAPMNKPMWLRGIAYFKSTSR